MMLIEGSLEVYLPTIWTVEKQSREVKSEVRRLDQHARRVTRKKIRTRYTRVESLETRYTPAKC